MQYYCGPRWFPKIIRRWLSNKFNDSCKFHDMDYETAKLTRRDADRRFLINMLKQSNSSKTDMVAALFFIAVKIGGVFSYGRKR